MAVDLSVDCTQAVRFRISSKVSRACHGRRAIAGYSELLATAVGLHTVNSIGVSGCSVIGLTASNLASLECGLRPVYAVGSTCEQFGAASRGRRAAQDCRGHQVRDRRALLFVARASSGAGAELSVRVSLRTVERSAAFPYARGVGSRAVP